MEKCVYYVLNQTYYNIEIILVDDGSESPARDLCDLLAARDPRIIVIHKQNGGLSSSRNVGIENATGDYVGFIDSDDYIAEDFYATLIDAVKDELVIACSHIVRVTENGDILGKDDPHIDGGIVSMQDYVRELLLHVGDVSTCSKLFHNSLIGDIRFDEGKLNEDLLFMMEIAAKAKSLSFTNKIGYYYLVRSGSISSKYGKAIEDMAPNSIKVREIVYGTYPALKQEANRFALFQNMAYLLLVPVDLRHNKNKQYVNAPKYVRSHFFNEGICNKYLGVREKAILLAQVFAPGFVADLYQRKEGKTT